MPQLIILRQELIDEEKHLVEFDFAIGKTLFRCWRARPSKHGDHFWVTPPSRLNHDTGVYTDYVEFNGELKTLVNTTLSEAAALVVANPPEPPEDSSEDIPF